MCVWKDFIIPHSGTHHDYIICVAALEMFIDALQTAAVYENRTFLHD